MTKPKVSMVMPCYNKAAWIGGVLDSVIAQKWDNMEIILVNDGSTDGTREVIAQYEPKLRSRGYETVIIDQENGGVAAAVYTGLKRASGEFICQVDADDELDPEYVSAMAEWLDEHPSDDWVVCDSDRMYWNEEGYNDLKSFPPKYIIRKYPYKILESYLLLRVMRGPRHMIRRNYFDSCRLLDGFQTEPRISQEAQFFVPLALGGSIPVHVHRPLYRYIQREGSIMSDANSSYAESLAFSLNYNTIIENTLASRICIEGRIKDIVAAGKIIHEHNYLSPYKEYDNNNSLKKLFDIVGSSLQKEELKIETTVLSGFSVLARYYSNNTIGRISNILPFKRKSGGRIIAYAAFGRASKGIRSGLINSDICPDIFWDAAAEPESAIENIPVAKPEFNTLTDCDTVLILLKNPSVIKTVENEIINKSAASSIRYYYDVLDYLAEYYYGKICCE